MFNSLIPKATCERRGAAGYVINVEYGFFSKKTITLSVKEWAESGLPLPKYLKQSIKSQIVTNMIK